MKSNCKIKIFLIIIILIVETITVFADKNSIVNNKLFVDKLKILQDSIDQSSNNNKIIQYAQDYFELTKNSNDKLLLAKGYQNIGIANWLVADYKISITNFNQSLRLAEEVKDTILQINSYIYLGLINNRFYDYKVSEEFYKKAYNLAHQFKNTFYIASTSWNMAFVSYYSGNTKIALEYSFESLRNLKISKFESEYQKNFAYGLAYYYLSSAYSNLNYIDSAIKYLHLTIEINNKINNLNILAPAYSTLMYNLNQKKLYNEALSCGYEAIKLSKTINNFSHLTDAYYWISESYFGLGKFDSSRFYKLEYDKLRDTLFQNDTRVLTAKLEKENLARILNKEKELEKQKFQYTIIISIIIFCALIFSSILLYSRYRLKNKLNIQLSELNATKDKFFTIISHDLKTPISSFNNLTEILTDYFQDFTEDEKLKHLNSLKDSSAGILKLLENLLTWSRIQTEKIKANPEVLQLVSIVQTEIQNQKQFAEKKNIQIISEIQTTTLVFADKDMISMVIRNLLSNAIKYTFEDGTITISSGEDKEFIEIGIIDSGVGIKDEDKSKLFILDVKHSTVGTQNEKGSGLGLNLCKEFIERNRGKIWFESQFGKGSTFKFTLPKAII